MKNKKRILLSVLASAALLTSCGGQGGPQGETLKKVDILTAGSEGKLSKFDLQFELLFKKDSEVPYLSLDDGFAFLNYVKGVRMSDPTNQKSYYRLNKDGQRTVVVDENGAKVTLDPNTQTIVYHDFENFLTVGKTEVTKPNSMLGLTGKEKCLKVVSSTLAAGKDATIDLKPYSGLDLYVSGSKTYLPLATFNDLFHSVFNSANLAYNYKNVYYVPAGGLTETIFGITSLTALGEDFYKADARQTLSKEILNYNYQEACLKFDYFYGLKDVKGYSSFASFVESLGLKGDFDNPDPKKADDALRLALTHLVDGHTLGTVQSLFYEFGTAVHDSARANKKRAEWVKASDEFQESRDSSQAPLGNHYEPNSQTYFIAFDTFTPINTDLLYMPMAWDEPGVVNANTALQFASAYQYLTSAEGKSKVKNVVVDLATNDGGSSDALIYGLSTLLGQVKTNVENPLTGSINETVYKADLNVDGVIDDKDVGLVDLGYNVAILSSIYTFSSGNAMPAFAKANGSKIKTAGETSGGGACAVRTGMTPLGGSYSYSGLTRLSTMKDGKPQHIDGGVPADISVTRDSMFDRVVTGTLIGVGFPL